VCPTRTLTNALRGFDDVGVVLTHPRKQLADRCVVLIRAVELEEARSTGQARCENAIALEVVDGALNDAKVFIEERRQLARIGTVE
jgi:hypothetical protein